MHSSKTTPQFIQEAISVHGNAYDYSRVEYVNNHTKINITCPKHGIFEQRPEKHLLGNGCKFCAKKALHVIDFAEQANDIHKNKYNYSLVSTLSMKAKIPIICPQHGTYIQRAEVHLRGSGCPICHRLLGSSLRGKLARISTYKDTPTTLYIITIEIQGVTYNKVGITTLPIEQRFARYRFTPILQVQLPLTHAFVVEKKLLQRLQQYRQQVPLPFNGWTELLNVNISTILTEYGIIKDNTNG
jgi:hypothetical protein